MSHARTETRSTSLAGALLVCGVSLLAAPQPARAASATLVSEHCSEEGNGRRDCISVEPRCRIEDFKCNDAQLRDELTRPFLTPVEQYAALIARAGCLLDAKRWKDAIGDFDAAIALMPDLNSPLIGKARALIEGKNHAAAIGVLEEALVREPGEPAILELRAGALLARGRTAEALTDLTAAIDKLASAERPGEDSAAMLAGLYQQRAKAARAAGRVKEAEDDLRRASEATAPRAR